MSLPGHPDSKPETGNGDVGERRVQLNLRLIYDKACQMTLPFYDSKQSWGDSSLTMYARQTLREAYPDLTQQEIAILFSAVSRFHQSTPKNK